jgi:hypothetical protein
MRAWLARRTPRQILTGGLVLFLIYAWPGFIGWDTRSALVDARRHHFSDGHPPAIAWIVRICEWFISGPAGVLLVQAVTMLLGLYLVLKSRMTDRWAALVASLIFLFPPISGVTALIGKDALMAGFFLLGIGFLLHRRMGLALFVLVLASLTRWNALAATFVPMLLLVRWGAHTGIRRYALATATWLGVTIASFGINAAITDEHENIWYWSSAYQDIAGTLEYMPDLDDATLTHMLEGTPLIVKDHVHKRFRAVYNAGHYFQLMRGATRLFDIPTTEQQRAAVAAAWERIVLGHPREYLKYRVDNWRLLLQLERHESFSNVYVWFTVIGAPETIAELKHDAAPSKLQKRLIPASMAISLTPIYFVFVYALLCVLLLPFALRNILAASMLLSAIGYEAAWFFLAQTTDYRYSQWMIICALLALALVIYTRRVSVTDRVRDPVLQGDGLPREGAA